MESFQRGSVFGTVAVPANHHGRIWHRGHFPIERRRRLSSSRHTSLWYTAARSLPRESRPMQGGLWGMQSPLQARDACGGFSRVPRSAVLRRAERKQEVT